MATTPPPTRQRTPPAPLHGPKFDMREPYSPRRSFRINNGEDKHSSTSSAFMKSSPPPTSKRASTQQGTPRKLSHNRMNSQDFSPPASPSFAKNDRPASPALHRGASMLPTPAKTPRKRDVDSNPKITATARVLFPGRPSTLEEAMPTPRRSRKGKKYLDALAEDDEDVEKIQIYTDSRDRIPEADEDEDNPFVVRKSSRNDRPTNGYTSGDFEWKPKHGMSKTVDEAVANGEGMVYVFRGKKIFRRFDDTHPQPTTSPDLGEVDDPSIQHRAGPASHQRLTRSSLKPRLLFPPAKVASPAPVDADEEALTDIEGPEPQTISESEASELLKTPAKKQMYQPATPPTTGRRTRRSGARDVTPTTSTSLRARKVKEIRPFDMWQRTKPISGAAVPAKRSGGALEREMGEVGKRTRG